MKRLMGRRESDGLHGWIVVVLFVGNALLCGINIGLAVYCVRSTSRFNAAVDDLGRMTEKQKAVVESHRRVIQRINTVLDERSRERERLFDGRRES